MIVFFEVQMSTSCIFFPKMVSRYGTLVAAFVQSSLLRLLPLNQEEDLHQNPSLVHSQEEREENAKRIPCPFLAGSGGGSWG